MQDSARVRIVIEGNRLVRAFEHSVNGLGIRFFLHRLTGRGAGQVPANLVLEIADRQLVARFQFSFENTVAVDANPVGAAEIAHDEIIAHLSDAAMSARHLS